GPLGGGRAKLRGSVDVVTLQPLARRGDVAELTAGYGLVVADECHHVPAAAFEHAVRQVPARRWLGLTATPYRRDKLDDLIALQAGRSGTRSHERKTLARTYPLGRCSRCRWEITRKHPCRSLILSSRCIRPSSATREMPTHPR